MIDLIKEFLIYGSYVAVIVLAVVGFKGLKQIYVMKKSAENRSLRESRQIAFEQTRFFARKIISRYEKLKSIAKQKEVKMVGDLFEVDVNWEMNKGQVTIKTSKREEYTKALDAMSSDIIKFCNLLEEFSIPFITQIAEIESAFRPCSATFCMYVRAFLPILHYHRQNFQQFSNVFELFQIWDKQIEIEKLERRDVNLKKGRETISTKISELKTFDLKPIGTNIEPERSRWISKLQKPFKRFL